MSSQYGWPYGWTPVPTKELELLEQKAADFDKWYRTAMELQDDVKALEDAAEMLWVVLANVSGSDWSQQSPEWQEAAARWRDHYFDAVRRTV